MKTRFCAAMLLAALSIGSLTGCAASAQTNPRTAAQVIPTVPVPLAPTATPATEPVPAPSRPASVYANLITKEEAITIALKDAGYTEDQVKALRTEFDYDNGRPEYEVDFHQGGYEYDYEIHAETGAILSKDKDRED